MCAEASSPIRQNGYYQVVVAGKIDASWSEWFGGVRIDWQEEADGRCVTILGIIADQAALRGLLNRMWDLDRKSVV